VLIHIPQWLSRKEHWVIAQGVQNSCFTHLLQNHMYITSDDSNSLVLEPSGYFF